MAGPPPLIRGAAGIAHHFFPLVFLLRSRGCGAGSSSKASRIPNAEMAATQKRSVMKGRPNCSWAMQGLGARPRVGAGKEPTG